MTIIIIYVFLQKLKCKFVGFKAHRTDEMIVNTPVQRICVLKERCLQLKRKDFNGHFTFCSNIIIHVIEIFV